MYRPDAIFKGTVGSLTELLAEAHFNNSMDPHGLCMKRSGRDAVSGLRRQISLRVPEPKDEVRRTASWRSAPCGEGTQLPPLPCGDCREI